MLVKEIVDKARTLRLKLKQEKDPFLVDKYFKELDDFMSQEVELK